MPRSFVIREQLAGNENFDVRNTAKRWLGASEGTTGEEQYSEDDVVSVTKSRLEQGSLPENVNLTEDEVRELLLKLVAYSPKVAKEVLKTATKSADTTKVNESIDDQKPLPFKADNNFIAQVALEEKPKQEAEEVALDKAKKEQAMNWIAQANLTEISKFNNKISTAQNILQYRVGVFKSNDKTYFTTETIGNALDAAKCSLTLAEKLFEPRGFWVRVFWGADYFAQNITKEQVEAFLKEESDIPVYIREHVRSRVLNPNFAEKHLLGTSLDRFFNEAEKEAIKARTFKLLKPEVKSTEAVISNVPAQTVTVTVEAMPAKHESEFNIDLEQYGLAGSISSARSSKPWDQYGDVASMSSEDSILSDLGPEDSTSQAGSRTKRKVNESSAEQYDNETGIDLTGVGAKETKAARNERFAQFIQTGEENIANGISYSEPQEPTHAATAEEQEALYKTLGRGVAKEAAIEGLDRQEKALWKARAKGIPEAAAAEALQKQKPSDKPVIAVTESASAVDVKRAPVNRKLFDNLDNVSVTSSRASSARIVTHLQPQSPDEVARRARAERQRLESEKAAEAQREKIKSGALGNMGTGSPVKQDNNGSPQKVVKTPG